MYACCSSCPRSPWPSGSPPETRLTEGSGGWGVRGHVPSLLTIEPVGDTRRKHGARRHKIPVPCSQCTISCPNFQPSNTNHLSPQRLMRQLLTGKHLLLVRVRARRVDRELAKVGCRVPAGDVAPPGHTICQGTPCGCLMSLDRYLQDDMHSSAQVSIIKQATCRTICPHPPVVSGLKTGPSGVSCTAPERNCLQYECLARPMYVA